MNARFNFCWTIQRYFFLFFLFPIGLPVHAQNVIYQLNNNNSYQIGLSGLTTDDVVFYRYSDGFHQIGHRSSNNLTAAVSRKFPPGTTAATVSAFVAKKNGSLGYASPATIVAPVTCSGCNPPYVGLGDAEYIRLGYSWLGYANIPDAMTDITVSPNMATPAQPWLLLTVTVKPVSGASIAEINLPAIYTYDGTIYKNVYGQSVSQGNINSVQYNNNKVTINFNGTEQHESNVYLLLRGNPEVGQTYNFDAVLKDIKNTYGSSELRLETRQVPHDPNIYTSDHEFFCPRQIGVDPVRYRIEFQNIGEAPAEDVVVTVYFEDPNYLNNGTLTLVGSEPLPVQDVIYINNMPPNSPSNLITFFLNEINLPGLYQYPKPPLEKTIGWVEFELVPFDCLPETAGPLKSYAVVTFLAPGFQEDMETNRLKQLIGNTGCPDPDRACDTTLNNPAIRSSDDLTTNVLNPVCFPSPFSDILQIEVPVATENTKFTAVISDLTGKQWLSVSRDVPTGEMIRETIETTNLPCGMYLVYINRGGGETTIHKVIKNN